MTRAIQFAAQVADAVSGPDWNAKARQLEEHGFTTIAVPDEMVGSGQGEFYSIERAECRPARVQKPYPPILVAGGPEILALAGAEADIVAIGLHGVGRLAVSVDVVSPDAVHAQLEYVRAGAEQRFAQVELSTFIDMVLTDDREKALAEMAAAGGGSRIARNSVFMAVGNLQEIEAHILRLREDLGITCFCLRGPFLDKLGPIVESLTGRS